ncbi:MAG: hypothetical protein KGV44_10440 [Flavobacteriaceae bacterium]|nr:hypothetical protein [Flavobacteriaceae bacterium]
MKYIKSYEEALNEGVPSSFADLYGDDLGVIQEQVKRYKNLIVDFSKVFKEEKGVFFSSPGRTEIGGNHTDHNYGKVLAGSVNMDNIALVSKADDIVIYSHGFERVHFSLDNLEIDKNDFFSSKSLVKGILARFKQLGYQIGGFHAYIDGCVPKGSGLSSSASYEVLMGTILSHLYNDGKISALEIAQIGQWSENNYFGKPCGLMDQTACAVGGLVTIDFEDPNNPIVNSVPFDFTATDFSLIITDTGGNHANLNEDYSAIPREMKSVAQYFGKEVLREISLEQVLENAMDIREKCGDRAFLRACHFFNENKRVSKQVKSLEINDFKGFLELVKESGFSSYMYNQNIFTPQNVQEQGVSVGLVLSEEVLRDTGAWRVHGGGIAGTIQAFVPKNKVKEYVKVLENTFGEGSCHQLFIRPKGSVVVEI